ncbi:hypothetical protein [Paludisphaera mucosa]|uniref:Uncharacterized protein n=1 Tax=Paludisphaera mucosa TaxID=3030827 RepID=A0ABT6FJZ9_9BACT|nr:hypothetical protein [Paludisphaera mucosa]MDG3007905.1 hypothetical protein [Paludisphaera mucosa]
MLEPMEERILEGTWEEIASRGPELAGRRVRLTVLDEPESGGPLDVALAPLIAIAERLTSPTPAESSVDWSEGVVEKFRRQGFDL